MAEINQAIRLSMLQTKEVTSHVVPLLKPSVMNLD